MQYALTATIAVIVSLAAALWYQAGALKSARHELAETHAASEAYKRQQAERTKRMEADYAKTKADIDASYQRIIDRLRKESSDTPAATPAGKCAGERSAGAGDVQAVLLDRLAEVARYADELKLHGMNCEALNE